MPDAFNPKFIENLERAQVRIQQELLPQFDGPEKARVEGILKSFGEIIESCKHPNPKISINPKTASAQRLQLLGNLFKMGQDADVSFEQVPDYCCFKVIYDEGFAPVRSVQDIFPARSALVKFSSLASKFVSADPLESLKNISKMSMAFYGPVGNAHLYHKDINEITLLARRVKNMQEANINDIDLNELEQLKIDLIGLIKKTPLFAISDQIRKNPEFIKEEGGYDRYLRNSYPLRVIADNIQRERKLPEEHRIFTNTFKDTVTFENYQQICNSLKDKLDDCIDRIGKYCGEMGADESNYIKLRGRMSELQKNADNTEDQEQIESIRTEYGQLEAQANKAGLGVRKKVLMRQLMQELNDIKTNYEKPSRTRSTTTSAIETMLATLNDLMEASVKEQKSFGTSSDLVCNMIIEMEDFFQDNALGMDGFVLGELAESLDWSDDYRSYLETNFQPPAAGQEAHAGGMK